MCNTTDKVRYVKPLKIYWKPHRKKIQPKNRNSKIQLEIQLENPTRNQTRNPTRNPNSVNRQPLFNRSGLFNQQSICQEEQIS